MVAKSRKTGVQKTPGEYKDVKTGSLSVSRKFSCPCSQSGSFKTFCVL